MQTVMPPLVRPGLNRPVSAWLLWVIVITGLLPAVPFAQVGSATSATPCHAIDVYHRTGCPHCERALEYFDDFKDGHPSVLINIHELGESPQVRQRFMEINQHHQVERPGVPTIVICDEIIVGFDTASTTGREVEFLLGSGPRSDAGPASSVAAIQGNRNDGPESLQTDWFGEIDAETLGLPLFTIVIGLIDGFNPCAMWVLLFLLSLLVNLRDRNRILLIAGTFVIVSGLVYFAFMAAWLNMFLIIGFSRTLQVIVGLVAITIGSIHLKDFFASGKGLSLSIPDSAKPGIYARVRRVIHAENIFAALIAVIVLAVVVNLVELVCTAGLPAVYTQILTSKELSMAAYYGYLVLYNLAYIVDDALMVGIVVYSLSRHKLDPQQGRWLKLLSGAVILVLGALLVFAPRLLF